MKTRLPRLNELRRVLASAEKKPYSGTRSNAAHYIESAPPDDRKPNFQAVSVEAILTHKNVASDRDAMSDVDSVVTNELPEHPNNVSDTSTKALTILICDADLYLQDLNPESGELISVAIPGDILRGIELTGSYRKLDEQVEHQNQENHRLHKSLTQQAIGLALT
ncbi:hypothetical protein CBS63078_11344 [Aspergillus niger]|nr:hypothetical protein CBS13152_11189 [Aspergillus niger]KAI2869439.1 hypothetical protein CBS11852_11235 [Aspergillus niger]KAI2884040.1 hypothetical protein CBS63078_11344 [Aspergillus niger]KAI3015022.1 hypothetical protein CBS147347_11336 [Aspergillus niger]KAI3033793.1 hypothetical protein CBS76997_11240 [Aspergillus niger]